jgi:hypothetical protein
MATTEESLGELLDQLNAKSLEDTHFKWTSDPLEAFPSYTITNGGASGTLHHTYGAVPNVTISSGTISATGASTGFWTTTGTDTASMPTWQTANPYTVMGIGTTVGQIGTLKLQGNNADIDINGKSLTTWMEQVEERLNILTPNPELEKEWDELRRLGDRYRKLEKKCRDKADMWKKLKTLPKSDC